MNEIAEVFIGIGGMVFLFIASYLFYQLVRVFKSMADIDERYAILEMIGLERVAKKKDIDLNKEIIKRSILKSRGKSFRRRIEDEMFTEMFGKDKKE